MPFQFHGAQVELSSSAPGCANGDIGRHADGTWQVLWTTPSRWENRTEAYHQAWDDQLAKGFRTPSPSWDGEWFLEVSLWVVSADTLCRYAYVSGAQTCSACVVPGKLVANKYGVWSSPRYWLVTIPRTNHQPMESMVYEHCPCEITKQLPVELAEAWKRVLPTGGLKGFIST